MRVFAVWYLREPLAVEVFDLAQDDQFHISLGEGDDQWPDGVSMDDTGSVLEVRRLEVTGGPLWRVELTGETGPMEKGWWMSPNQLEVPTCNRLGRELGGDAAAWGPVPRRRRK